MAERYTNNCPNCGAPIRGDKCEYCGTVFRDRREELTIQIDLPNVDYLRKCVEASLMTPNEARRRMGLDFV